MKLYWLNIKLSFWSKISWWCHQLAEHVEYKANTTAEQIVFINLKDLDVQELCADNISSFSIRADDEKS